MTDVEGSQIVADIGSGPGPNSAVVAARHQLLPIQIDANGEMLKRSALPHSARCQSLGTALPLRSGSVDVVISSLLLHHLHPQDQTRLLTELRRVARAGSLLLFIDQVLPEGVRESKYVDLVRQQFYGHLYPCEGVSRFDSSKEHPRRVDEMKSMIRDAGFTIGSETMLGDVVWAMAGRARDRRKNAR